MYLERKLQSVDVRGEQVHQWTYLRASNCHTKYLHQRFFACHFGAYDGVVNLETSLDFVINVFKSTSNASRSWARRLGTACIWDELFCHLISDEHCGYFQLVQFLPRGGRWRWSNCLQAQWYWSVWTGKSSNLNDHAVTSPFIESDLFFILVIFCNNLFYCNYLWTWTWWSLEKRWRGIMSFHTSFHILYVGSWSYVINPTACYRWATYFAFAKHPMFIVTANIMIFG